MGKNESARLIEVGWSKEREQKREYDRKTKIRQAGKTRERVQDNEIKMRRKGGREMNMREAAELCQKQTKRDKVSKKYPKMSKQAKKTKKRVEQTGKKKKKG